VHFNWIGFLSGDVTGEIVFLFSLLSATLVKRLLTLAAVFKHLNHKSGENSQSNINGNTENVC